MKVILELVDQTSNIRRVTLRHDIVIGRGSDCNLRVASPQVSRRHCFVRIGQGRVAITDLDSCNGTWLDGQRVVPGKRYFIDDGMKLSVGPVKFIARITADEDISALAPGERQTTDDVAALTPDYEAGVHHDPLESDSMDFAADGPGDEDTGLYAPSDREPGSSGPVEIQAGSGSEEIIEIDEAYIGASGGVLVEVQMDDDTIAAQVLEPLQPDDFNSHDDIEEVIVLDDD